MLRTSVIAAALSAVFLATPADASVLDFTGPFAVANWTTTLNGTPPGGGTPAGVDTSGAPFSVTINGGDSGNDCPSRPITPCSVDFTIAMGTYDSVSFHWDYLTMDAEGPEFDPFGYLVNGAFTRLTNDGGSNAQSGDISLTGLAGKTFGFRVDCTDCQEGGASATISAFQAQVPEPGSLALLALGLAGLAAARRRRPS